MLIWEMFISRLYLRADVPIGKLKLLITWETNFIRHFYISPTFSIVLVSRNYTLNVFHEFLNTSYNETCSIAARYLMGSI